MPNLVLNSEDTNYKIGKYGRMKLNYLKNNKKSEYTILLMDGKLNNYIHEIDTEELKANIQLEGVRCMNSVKNRAEEIILNELIYEEAL